MNRVWEYDITDLVAGDAADTVYQVKVILHSPTKFIAEEDTKCPVGGSSDAMPGFPHIRKAACMYGWDWGPRLPDAGLFREASVLGLVGAGGIGAPLIFSMNQYAWEKAGAIMLGLILLVWFIDMVSEKIGAGN